jgi:hypothetical protein
MSNLRARLTPELLAAARVSSRAVALWQANGDYLGRLTEEGCWQDAARVLAFHLPMREAIWWGCLCAWHVIPSERSVVEQQALAAALRWVVEPDEDHRLSARLPGERAGIRTTAGCLATATYWSGGSPPDQPSLKPSPLLGNRLVLAAVFLAAVRDAPMRCGQRFCDFTQFGLHILAGERPWPVKPAPIIERVDELVAAHA